MPESNVAISSNYHASHHTKDDGLPFGWLSLFLLLYVFLPAFILSSFLLLRVGSPALAYWSSLAVLSGLAAWGWRKKIVDTKRFAAACLCFLLLVVFAHAVSWRFFDFSHDGLAYHQPATARIAEGFNPVHDGYMYLIEPHGIWRDNWSYAATYFPKLTWYFAAPVYAALGDIELGKAYNLVLLFAALFFVLQYTRGERYIKRALWLLACLNPVALIQATEHRLDGALASLCIIALFYAWLHFSGKFIPRNAHVMAVLSLAMLFCTKQPGIAFGGIIVLCICFHRLFREYWSLKKSFVSAFAAAFKLGLRIGIPLFLLAAVIGFSPYLTNLINGRHIFYPLMGAVQEAPIAGEAPVGGLESYLRIIYPDAHNRVTRLLTSIAAYPTPISWTYLSPPVLKNPLSATRNEWLISAPGAEFIAGGWLGPLFFLILLLSLPLLPFLLRGGENPGNGWLILTLCLMLLIHPYSVLIRYVPFLWALPFLICLSAPRRWEYYILAFPVILGLVNAGGVTYATLKNTAYITRTVTEAFAPHRGEYALLDRTVFRANGILDRFDITQRFANPEHTTFPNRLVKGPFWERRIPGRPALGSNIAFAADIPHLPISPIVFADETSEPWFRMSEGILDSGEASSLLDSFLQPSAMASDDAAARHRWNQSLLSAPRGFWNYSERIKFYMRVTERPIFGMEFTLTASLREEDGTVRPHRMSVYANERRITEWHWNNSGSVEKTITLPLDLLEESYNSPLNLLTLRFDLADEDGPDLTQRLGIMLEKMEFRTAAF